MTIGEQTVACLCSSCSPGQGTSLEREGRREIRMFCAGWNVGIRTGDSHTSVLNRNKVVQIFSGSGKGCAGEGSVEPGAQPVSQCELEVLSWCLPQQVRGCVLAGTAAWPCRGQGWGRAGCSAPPQHPALCCWLREGQGCMFLLAPA